MNFRKNMELLRLLSSDYCLRKVSNTEYRIKRTVLLNMIDEELNGIKVSLEDVALEDKVESSLINKAISFLKIDKIKQLN